MELLNRMGVTVTRSDVERTLRERLDNWRWWMGVAYFGITSLIVGLVIIGNRTAHTAAREAAQTAAHQSEIVSNADTQYSACLKSIPTLISINHFVRTSLLVDKTILENSVAVLRNTKPGTRLYKVRVRNVSTLRAALVAPEHIYFKVPTMKECAVLEAKLLSSP